MELQWPLIVFTTLVAWSAGVFGAQGVLALKGEGREIQMPALIASVAILVVSGIAVFFHLEHWERIFNGFGHLSSGITQEFIAIVVFAIVAVVYFVMLRKSDDGGTVPKWLAVVAIVLAVVLAAVCAHSYMMAARPAWNSVLEVLSIVGVACGLGPATLAVLAAVKGSEVPSIGTVTLAGVAVAALCAVAYAAFLQASPGSFVDVGHYFDPTTPTAAVADPTANAAAQAPVLWGGAVVVGAVIPLALAFLGWRKGGKAWTGIGAAIVACLLVGAVCLRVAFYGMGLSVFMFY